MSPSMTASADELDGDWDMAMVCAWFGVTRQTIYKRMDAGSWPRPCVKRGNRIGWRDAVVTAALNKTAPKS